MYVLGIFDNPMDDLDQLKMEQQSFQLALTPLQSKENFKYEAYANFDSMDTLMKFINDKKDELVWFHFSGHHDKNLGIRLNEGNFSSLTDHLLGCKKLKGVFINGCSSKETIDKLSKKIPICIGTYEPIYDRVATKFSEYFYNKMNTLDKWNSFESIHEEFRIALADLNTAIANNEKLQSERKAQRGGGDADLFEKEEDFYFISESNNTARDTFEGIDNLKIIQENPNQKLLEVIELLNREEGDNLNSDRPTEEKLLSVTRYIKKPPVIFKEILKAFDILSDNNFYSKYRKIGIDRQNLIKNYFYAYLDLYRYSILSLTWDISNSEFKINDFLKPIKFLGKERLNQLTEYYELLSKKMKGSQLEFISQYQDSINIIEKGIDLFMNPENNFVESELYFYELLKASKFLNDYQFKFIYSRYYMKNRIDQGKYTVKSFVHGDTEPRAIPFENNEDVYYDCTYSIYICNKKTEEAPIINLSPFYFDKNLHEKKNSKIDLFVLQQRNEENESTLRFDYAPIYKATQALDIENMYIEKGNSKESIKVVIDDEIIEDIYSDNDDDYAYKIRSLFNELTSIINH